MLALSNQGYIKLAFKLAVYAMSRANTSTTLSAPNPERMVPSASLDSLRLRSGTADREPKGLSSNRSSSVAETSVAETKDSYSKNGSEASADASGVILMDDLSRNGSRASALPNTAETTTELRRRLGKELYRMELDLVGGGRIAGKPCDCQPGDSLVYVTGDKNSVLTLAQAAKRKTRGIISHKNKQQVTAHLSRDYSNEMIELSSTYHWDILKATPEHPFLIAKDAWKWNWRTHGGICESCVDWIKAKDISAGDFIAFPRIDKTQDMDVITPELAEILGWYLAEGCKVDNRITLSLGHHEIEYIARIKQLFYTVFGKYPKEYNRDTSLHLAYADKEFTGIFDAFGHTAHEKRLPDWALWLPAKKQGRLLRGLLLGDGCLGKAGIAFATVSFNLAYQIRFILFRLGILHSLAKRNTPDTVIDGRLIHSNYPVYTIRVSGDAMERLALLAELPWKSSCVRAPRNYGWAGESAVFLPVRSVSSSLYEGKVYNLTVDEDESYLTPHGAAHNCLSAKHSLGLEAMAEELMSYSDDAVFGDITNWLRDHETEFEPAEIGKREPEYYKKMAPSLRNFRKRVMGTEELQSLLKNS